MNIEYKRFPVTIGLISICILVFLYTTMRYGLDMNAMQAMEAGAFNPVFVQYNHEYYRIISANFIHFGLMHIVCNSYSLYNVGLVMEAMLGKVKYLILIVGSMIATTLFPYLLYILFGFGINSVSGGISGVIFGLLGGLLALSLLYKDVYAYLFKQVLPSILVMLALSIAIPSISMSGHVSGMLGGFITMMVIELFIKRKQQNDDNNLVN